MVFYLSKILWILLNPFNLLCVAILFRYIFKLLNLKSLTLFFTSFSFVLFMITAVLPAGSFLNYLLEKDYYYLNSLNKEVDGILILSGATNPYLSKIHKQVNLNGSVERLTESVSLIRKYPNAKIIFSGGSGDTSNSNLSHSSVAKIFFENMGINVERIIFENQSRNTYENILFSKKYADLKNHETWLLVTSAFHLKRSMYIAEKLEWKLIPFPTDFNHPKKFSFNPSINLFSNISAFQKYSHEWIGIVSYYLMGRSSRLF